MIELLNEKTDYIKYRGKCKEMSEHLCKEDPTLTLQRGWYECPIWGKQQHWWCTTPEGKIIDPTKDQFPSKGIGTYIKYAGVLVCEYCGTSIQEDDAYFVEQHVYCSYRCYGKDVGF